MGDETRKAIGLFWDIENCNVPRYVSALSVVQRLRERFFRGLREAEFMCVCDINKESKHVIEELNNGQVNVVHISATAKNAADDKIRQSLRRFADTHPAETKIILISGDVNFASELSDLRHRKHMYIILIHGKHVHEALLSCSHEHYNYDDLVANLPWRAPPQDLLLVVSGYASKIPQDLIKKRLSFLCSNCGGKVISVGKDKSFIGFSTQEAAYRAKRRMEGEDVCGLPITVTTSTEDEAIAAAFSPSKYKQPRSHSRDGLEHGAAPGAPGSSSPVKQFRSQQSAFTNTYSSAPNTYASSRQNVFQAAKPFQQLEDGAVYATTSVAMKDELTVEYSQRSQGKAMRNVAMFQHQKFPEAPEKLSGMSSESQLQPTPVPIPNLSEPPPTFSSFSNTLPLTSSLPLTSAEGSIPGTLNISKTYNVTYQSSYTPRLHYPQPLYPYQQRPPLYNPGLRQSTKFTYDFNRPRSRNAALGNFTTQQQQLQNRPYSSRGPSSTPDVFEDEDEDGLEAAYFKAQQQMEGGKGGPVDLTVTNLDYNISKKEWKKILAATFQPQVQVLGICVRTQADNTSIASIKVPSIEDARYAISQFHRRKIGYKRINVALNDDRDQAPAESTRQETISILSDAKAYTMPVFKFIENYEKRYHKSVSVSDLYKMKDVVEIMDRGGAGRMVRLARGVCPSPSPTADDLSDPLHEEGADQPVCLTHCPEGSPQYAEAMSISMLPNVRLQRKHFAAHVHSLLLNHNGVMPLMSFPVCYDAEFGMIPMGVEDGVPMEHLISCVPGVEIVMSKKGVKVIHFQENKDPPGAEAICGRTSPMLSQQMALLSREIGDLLRQSRTCSIPASKFIPSYHHHFGRQCRVADYGYTKLAELFEALPHVLQVLGTGDRKVLTLSHRAQVKRFIADVLKVLKTQPGKQLAVSDLPATFERMLFRKFDITHYGVAFIEDMFMDIPPTSILITLEGNKTIMAIPKRDQTPEEVKRTEQFALELVDLLKHNPQCRMTFNKFIPAYHHHFGRQCRVADYGFTRLTDLFESVSQVVEVLDDEEERMIKLTAPEMRMVLAEQMTGLLRESPSLSLPLDQVLLAFQRQYGFPLRLSDFGVHDVKSLLGKIKHRVSVDTKEIPAMVRLRPAQEMPTLALRVIQLLMDQSGGCLPLVELCSRYRSMFGVECDVQKIQEELLEYVQVSTESDDGSALIRLTALQILGRDLRIMLKKVGSVALHMFSQVYQEHFVVELKPALYGFPDISSLLRALPHIVKLTGRPGRKFVELSHILSNGNNDEMAQIDRVSSVTRFEDYLSAPVPSAIPSPELQPSQNVHMPDLMNFGNPDAEDKVWDMPEDEKKGLGTPLCRTPTSELLHLADTALPSPNPPRPTHQVFPGNVPLISPFPPPPPLPTDIAPPPLTEGCRSDPPQWPPFLRHPPPPPALSSSAPASDRRPQPSSTSAPPPPSPPVEPAGLEDLPAASLQWKEMLEGGWWNPTPQQLQNLASMGLLGLAPSCRPGAPEGGLCPPAANSKPRPGSAPAFGAPGSGRPGERKDDARSADAMMSEPSLRAEEPVTSKPVGGSAPAVTVSGKTEPAAAALSIADPSIIHSSLYVAPCSASFAGSQPVFGVPHFGGGQFMEVKVTGPAARCYKGPVRAMVSATATDKSEAGKDATKETPKANGVESLQRDLEGSLSLSEEGKVDATAQEKSISAGPHQGQSCVSKAESTCLLQVAPLATTSHEAVLQGQPQQVTMTPAGDASTVLASSSVGGAPASPGKPAEAGQGSDQHAIPANDSFSLDQPLDTSSTRSFGSASTRSRGSMSDSMSSSPSPRKNPRRAHLAAKFFNASR